MKYVISLSTLFTILLSSQTTHGIFSLPLGNIEKKIFLREVNHIGKKAALQKIYKTKNPHYFTKGERCYFQQFSCFIIKTYIQLPTNDPLSQLILDTIKQKEIKNGYIPKPIEEKNNQWISYTLPNNYIENYTQYWHKENYKGEAYVELISDFNDKESLLDILNQE